MISIYSIKEIIQASENIMNFSTKKKELHQNNVTINQKKMIINEPLIITKDVSSAADVPKEIEDVIFKAEKSQIEKIENLVANDKKLKKNKTIMIEDVVNQLYILFNKKIKKNTLKLIVELKNEITNLDEKIISLKQNEKKIYNINQLLKKDISDLVNIESNLNYSLKQKNLDINSINDAFNESQNKIIKLENDNSDLKSKIITYQNQIKKIHNNNSELNNNNSEFKTKIDIYQNQIAQLKNENSELSKKMSISFNNYKILEEKNNKLNLDLKELEELKKYKYEIEILNQKNLDLETTLDKLKVTDDKNELNLDIIKTLEEKINFYQEENIRISNELSESRNKFDITKNKITDLEKQRFSLIEKINSVNEAINESKIVSNVFEVSSIEEKNISHKELNPKSKKITSKENFNIDKKIKAIFDR